MDIKFQPQAIELTIFLTPAEAAQILIDLPPILFSTKTPLGRLAKALHHVSQMNNDDVIAESLAEMQVTNSLGEADRLRSESAGQRGDSRS